MKGTIQDPFQYKGADLQLSLAGPDLSEIFPLLGIPGPPTPPYRISGKLHREPDIWRVTDVAWHAGDSDLSGDVAIDQRSKPSRLMAHLFSQHLAFADLAPLVGATPGKTGNVSRQQAQTEARLEARGELFPNVPLHVERLRAMNMDVSLDAKRVVAPSYLPVQSLMTRVQVENGRATVRPLDMGFGGGKVTGRAVDRCCDRRSDEPRKPALRRGGAGGVLSRLALLRYDRRQVERPRRLGRHGPVAGPGHGLRGRRYGDDHGRWIGKRTDGERRRPADRQCTGALRHRRQPNSDPLCDWAAKIRAWPGGIRQDLMDTQKSVLHLDGEAALQTQELQSKISADPKQFDLLDLHSPVIIEGKIRSPSISLGRKIPIPTPDFGGAKDADCNELTRELWAAKPG